MVMGQASDEYAVVVLGAGPGGYVAAIRAAQLGKTVALVDKAELGGVCLHQGCIPSKALIHAADYFFETGEKNRFGVELPGHKIDVAQLQKWKANNIDTLTKGIEFLTGKLGITVVKGRAFFTSSKTLLVEQPHGTLELVFKKCILATGSKPVELKGLEYSKKTVKNSDDALAFSEIPKRLVVVGGGYIGVELGTVYAKLGSKVTIVQRSGRILSNMDAEAAEMVQKRLNEIGVEVLVNTTFKSHREENGVAFTTVDAPTGERVLESETVFVALGRSPLLSNIGLEKTKVKLDSHGFVSINEECQTTDPHVFAIGDITGPPQLAHRASKQGKVAAEVIGGKKSAFDNRCIPAVVYSDPEISSVGLTEEEARATKREIVVGKAPYSALGRAVSIDFDKGFFKVVADKKTTEILGFTICGKNASDLIGECALAIEMGAFLEDVAGTIHPHPTFSEGIGEACENALGKSIHVRNR